MNKGFAIYLLFIRYFSRFNGDELELKGYKDKQKLSFNFSTYLFIALG